MSSMIVVRGERCRVVALLVACIVTGGCTLALMAPVVVDGQSFPHERVSDLRAGMPSEEVQALLGAPLRQAQRGRALVWVYDVRRQRRECRVLLFGSIPIQPTRTDRHELELIFGNAGLERAVYRERSPDHAVERILVGSQTVR